MTVKLSLYHQDTKVQDFILDDAEHIIGRSDEADITLNDRWVSRRHCRLRICDGRIAVEDLGSTHGTYVNDRPVSEAFLSEGDILVLGLSRLVACFGDVSTSHGLQVVSHTRPAFES